MAHAVCAFCRRELAGDSRSREHIIPNAIGGRKTVANFICRGCNNNLGRTWDAALAKQFRSLSTMLGIKRSSGTNQPFDVQGPDGKPHTYHADDLIRSKKPVFDVKRHDGGVFVNLQAPSWDEMVRQVQGVVKNYPWVDGESLLQQAAEIEPIPNFETRQELSNEKAYKSAVKTCLGLAYDCGLTIEECELARAHLLEDGERCFGTFAPRDIVVNRPSAPVFHSVSLMGDSKSGLLLAYLEYFGFYRVVVCLSDTYSGEDLSASYSIDPLTGNELKLETKLDLEDAQIRRIRNAEVMDLEGSFQDYGKILEVALKRRHERQIRCIIDIETNNATQKAGRPDKFGLSAEEYEDFAESLCNHIVKYITENFEKQGKSG